MKLKILFGTLLAVGLMSSALAQTVKFTAQQTIAANGSVTPTLTWCTEKTATAGLTCSGIEPASSCTASGSWTGAKTGAGTVTLAAVSTTQTYTLQCSWPNDTSMKLNWMPPTKNDDGSNLTDLAGYKVYYGTSASALNTIKDVPNAGVLTTTMTGLTPATWFAAMTAYNTSGIESVKSTPPISKTITVGPAVSQSVKVAFPNAPTGLTVE